MENQLEKTTRLEKHILETSGKETHLSFIKLDLPFSSATSFSEACLRGQHYVDEEYPLLQIGLEFWETFSRAKEVFQLRLNNPAADLGETFDKVVGMAYNRFLKFMEGHNDVLKKLKANKTLWKSEAQFNVYVAREILNPLSGGQCILNNDHQSALNASKVDHKEKTERMFLPEEYGWSGLGMGYEDGFYGEPDIILIPKEIENGETVIQGVSPKIFHDDDDGEEEEDQQDRKKRKKRKEEGESSEPGNSSPGGKTATEGKKSSKQKTGIHELSKCIATVITFADIQHKRHGELESFPVLRIHPRGFDIIIYNCEFDLLMTKYFGWTARSFLFLWIVLHYKIFQMQRLSKYKEYACGYRELVKKCDSLPKTDYKYGINKSHFDIAEVLYERDYTELAIKP